MFWLLHTTDNCQFLNNLKNTFPGATATAAIAMAAIVGSDNNFSSPAVLPLLIGLSDWMLC
ncbi:MAG TPA: hypothetical protein VFR94_19295 [Nitrososphaeraceae archaeon]|nr:hypothetical protein [Nitrososphaeraceae archaeon]